MQVTKTVKETRDLIKNWKREVENNRSCTDNGIPARRTRKPDQKMPQRK